MKKLITLIMALCMTFSMAACNSGEAGSSADTSVDSDTPASAQDDTQAEAKANDVTKDEPSGDKKDKMVIGMSMCMLDENHAKSMNYIKEFAAEYPETEVEVIVTNAESSVEKQIGDVESLILQNPDVIIIWPVDSVGSIPAVESVVKAGIPVLDTGFCVEGDIADVKVTLYDELGMGHLQGELMNKMLEENSDLNVTMGYIQGALAQTEQLKRYYGFVEACIDVQGEDSPRIKKVAEKTANWTTQEAMALTEDWLQVYPEMNAIVSASDEMAIGAINVFTAAGRDPKDYIVISVDGTANGLQHVRDGLIDGTVYMDMSKSVKGLFDVAIGLATGQTYDKEVNVGATAVTMVTLENIDEVVPAA